ncbi:MAG: hypothetical protein RL161_666 [Bacteroidota bacterium]
MQNSYFFFQHLIPRLSGLLTGSTLVSSFSQEKDELVLEFNNGKKSFFLRIIFSPTLSVIVFPESFKRARNNSADIFPAAVMRKVMGIRLIENERTFLIQLDNGSDLVFRMHGPSGNVLWLSGEGREVFRSSLKSDATATNLNSGRVINWSLEFFTQNLESIQSHYVTFGKEVWKWLQLNGYDTKTIQGKHQLILSCLKLMERSEFYLCRGNDSMYFSLLPFGVAESLGQDPIEAINRYYHIVVRDSAFLNLKRSLLKHQAAKLAQLESTLKKHQKRLEVIISDTHFREWADLVMANLHRIEPGTKVLTAERFVEPGVYVEIRLKPELSPQKNAEVFYRKARNREEEVMRLRKTLSELSHSLAVEQNRNERIQFAENMPALKEFDEVLRSNDASVQKKRLPYLQEVYLDYHILVGRSSADNYELTFRVASKEDLWLHARDVAGSHVIIRHKPGQNIPKPVIERAAALAAYHSKRKGESLCPVAYTRRKFVRKRKGDPAGMVVVDREQVILIEPAS